MDGRSMRPIDTDPDRAEIIGREALAKIGYIPIMKLARRAGWVTTKKIESARRSDPAFLAQAVAARDFVEVFSKYAVVAGVTSQADSPLPGPADAVAVGIVVIGLIDAGLLAGALLDALGDVLTPATGTTTSSPPVATTMPMATTAPSATSVPIARAEDDPKEIERRCHEMYTDCLETPRADERSRHGKTRCLMCRQVCVKNGGKWPARAVTATGSVLCDY